MDDLILNASHELAFDEIYTYISEPALTWWREINAYIQEKYQVKPKVTYSKCSAQRGWNVKYQKSNKSICTLYPQKDYFIILIVIKLQLLEMIEAMSDHYEEEVINIVRNASPFNGTKWLMIPVTSRDVLENVKELLVFKHEMSKKRV